MTTIEACPPETSRYLPAGWVIIPIRGPLPAETIADGMILVPCADSRGIHLIRARRALVESGKTPPPICGIKIDTVFA